MLDQEDLKWVATTSTELNSMLQQISRYADLARQHKGEYNYIEMLGERVELASKTAQSLFDRVTSRILEGGPGQHNLAAARGNPPEFTIVPAPAKPLPPAAAPSVALPPEPARSKTKPTKKSPTSTDPLPPGIEILNPKGSREIILIVEDEAEIAALAAMMLTEEGYKVIIAHDGFSALRIYQQISKQIGLIILDFFLPVMDGDAVFDELRALNPSVAVVLSSGFAEHGKLSNMLAQGLRGFIPKPYTREKLLEQVRSTLDAAG